MLVFGVGECVFLRSKLPQIFEPKYKSIGVFLKISKIEEGERRDSVLQCCIVAGSIWKEAEGFVVFPASFGVN